MDAGPFVFISLYFLHLCSTFLPYFIYSSEPFFFLNLNKNSNLEHRTMRNKFSTPHSSYSGPAIQTKTAGEEWGEISIWKGGVISTVGTLQL